MTRLERKARHSLCRLAKLRKKHGRGRKDAKHRTSTRPLGQTNVLAMVGSPTNGLALSGSKGNGLSDGDSEKLHIDARTARAMRTAVLNACADLRRGITLRDMVMAIKASQQVMKEISQKHHGEFLRQVKVKHSGKGIVNRFRQAVTEVRFWLDREKEDVERKYALLNILDALEKVKTPAQINSWDDAKRNLEKYMTFEPDDDDSATSNAENVEHNNVNTPLDKKEGSSKKSRVENRNEGNDDKSMSATDRVLVNKFRAIELAATTPTLTESSSPSDASKSKERIPLDRADQKFLRRLTKDYEQCAEMRKHPLVRESEEAYAAQLAKEKAEQEEAARVAEAQKRASALMRPLTPDEQFMVHSVLNGFGRPDDILAQVGTDSVQRGSMQRLQPGQWLNDEVIHFFLTVLSKRDEAICAEDSSKKRTHFFKSFFMSTLLNEGHATQAGMYEYRRVKRWSKKVPGKDIFNLDKICFPINQGGMHWVCAVAYMQEKRIHFYDSLGSDGLDYLSNIFQYIKDEHKDKKKAPLPNEEDWSLIECDPTTTPRQLNGYDCGVFTCMFIDFLSKDCPLDFLRQEHITQCRERIALSILKGKAIM